MEFRNPTAGDGHSVFHLVKNSPPLDPNSMYCNLLQCSHFSQTAILAEENNQLCGFITGYIIPEKPNTLFIWQVCVHKEYRGQGLAFRMYNALMANITKRQAIEFIETTITDENVGSWALFKKIAQSMNSEILKSVVFDKEEHFKGSHDSEYLVRIPIKPKG